MDNIRLEIEYDGERFCGWQVQPNQITIQGTIQQVLEEVVGLPCKVVGAGRTDSGVHAKGQVAHFMSPRHFEPQKWQLILNSKLPRDIRVLSAELTPSSFHAQRDALAKVYEYRIRQAACSSALDRRVLHYPRPLDWDKMEGALSHFVGVKDFKCFQAAGANVKTTVREIYRFDLFRPKLGEHLYRFEIEGSGFLKQMVRAIIGTLLEVGEGKRSAESIIQAMASRDRSQAGRTAPAHGLFLKQVKY